jgi:tripartite-type tricarboxylate transporter receptor subunit TctC
VIAFPFSVVAQQYPAKPIHIIVPYAPGAGTDTIARVIGTGLYQRLGQPVVVENRAGANGIIGAAYVSSAPPDGYTLLACTTALATNASLYKSEVTYDTVKSFTPVSLIVQATLLLVVHPALPVKNVRDLIALAKAHPDTLAFSSYGIGSSPHLAGELLSDMAGIKLLHIPFKGGAPAITEVISGRVAMTFATISAVLPFVQSGRVKALGVATLTRNQQHADIPTISESGLPDFEAPGGWTGICAPAGVSKEIVDTLHGAIADTVAVASVRNKFLDLGYEIFADVSAERFAAMIRAEVDKWAKVVRKLDIKRD